MQPGPSTPEWEKHGTDEPDTRHQAGMASASPARAGYRPPAPPLARAPSSMPLSQSHYDPQPFNPGFQVGTGLTDWLNIKAFGARGDGVADDTGALQAATLVAPPGGAIYVPAGIYRVSAPIIVPPTVSVIGAGHSLAYYGGSTPMPLSAPVLQLTPGFAGLTVGGQAVAGALVLLSQALGGYGTGSGNQALCGLTLDGRNAPAGTNGIEAWGPVWGVAVDQVGVYGLPNFGVATSSSAADGTGKAPDLWHVTRTHIAGCGSDGWNVNGGLADSYFALCEATGNAGNGWNMTGSNQRWVACKAEFNTLAGWRVLAAGGSGTGSAGTWLEGCSTDHNGQDGVLVYGVRNGPVCLDGCTLHGDGYQAGAGGGGYAGLRVAATSTATVLATGLRVLTVSGATPFPQYGVRSDGSTPSVVKLGGAGLVYGNTAATNATGTGTITTGADVLTGTGAWGT